jgi:hypothetical protein
MVAYHVVYFLCLEASQSVWACSRRMTIRRLLSLTEWKIAVPVALSEELREICYAGVVA